jgi:hypothetical protein
LYFGFVLKHPEAQQQELELVSVDPLVPDTSSNTRAYRSDIRPSTNVAAGL